MSLTACNVKNKSGSIRIKQAYEPPSQSDGIRVLVDRLWPRGRSKADLSIDFWLKDVAPSATLRKWFDHDPKKWGEFRTRYEAEQARRNRFSYQALAQSRRDSCFCCARLPAQQRGCLG